MTDAIQMLVQEHQLISRVVRMLPSLRSNIEAGIVDEAALSAVVDFFGTFADGCHHAKEEGLLFPALQERGISSKGCPVGTLKLEHQQGRNIARALKAAIDRWKAGDTKAASTMCAILKDASELYTDHIWREDYLLFPMSEKVFLKGDIESLTNGFEQAETNFGQAFHDKYERLVDNLERDLVLAGRDAGTSSRAPVVGTANLKPACCSREERLIALDQD